MTMDEMSIWNRIQKSTKSHFIQGMQRYFKPTQLSLALTLVLQLSFSHQGQSQSYLGTSLKYPNGIAAVVQKHVITYHDLRMELAGIRDTLRSTFGGNQQAYVQKLKEAVQAAMDRLIENKLILLDFEEEGYNLPETIIEERIEERILKLFDNRRSEWIRTLLERGLTIEMEKESIREQIIVDWMRYQRTSGTEIVISPVLVNAYYDGHKDEFYQVEQIRLRSITIPKSSNAASDTSLQIIEEIQRKIRAGAPFREMAALYSQDRFSVDGGDLPFWKDRDAIGIRPDMNETIFNLEVGEISPPIEQESSWQLFQVFDRKKEGVKSLHEVRSEIDSKLVTAERKRLEKQWITRLKRKYHVLTQDSSSGSNQGGGVSLLPFGLSSLFPEEFR